MRTRTLLRIATLSLGTALAALLAGWLVFVPSPRGPGYEFVQAWGGPGSGPGQFADPTGVAATSSEVFVADSRNGRIQVFDHQGRFRRQFGSPGSGLGELGRPMNLSLHQGRLYVAEYFNDRIQVFELDGTPVRTFGSPGDGPSQMDAPGGVAVAADGSVFVADFYNHRVQHLSPEGAFLGQWGTTGEPGTAAGVFTYPTDVAVSADGRVYVADGYADRIQAFSTAGRFLGKWGGPLAMNIHGPFNGWFATVTGVAVGPGGRVFAADFYNDRVQAFSAEGRFLHAFGTRGTGPGQFRHPIAVAVAPDGTVFVADFGNNRIQRWRPRPAGAGQPPQTQVAKKPGGRLGRNP